MKIVFFGTSEFAIPSLKGLIASGHKVLTVVTQPDRKKGRRLLLSPPPVKVLAKSSGIPVYQPEDASSDESAVLLKGLAPDILVVISFGQILKKEVLDIPRLYPLNLHGSLLPKYRGAAPTNWAIINGEKMSGVTIIKMNERMDEGDIALKREVKIDEEDTNITLNEKLAEIGAKALMEYIALIEENKTPVFVKQEDDAITYAPKLRKEDGLIDWSQGASMIRNKVRGFLPWPGAYTYFNGKTLKILSSEVARSSPGLNAEAGEVVEFVKGNGLSVRTGSEDLVIRYLQLEGKKALDADSFLRGHKIEKGFFFQ